MLTLPPNLVHVSADLTAYLCISGSESKVVLTDQRVHVCQGGCRSLGVCPPVNSSDSSSASICSSSDLLSAFCPAGFSIDGTDGSTVRGLIPKNHEVTKPDKTCCVTANRKILAVRRRSCAGRTHGSLQGSHLPWVTHVTEHLATFRSPGLREERVGLMEGKSSKSSSSSM